jgi:hypothetical protein
MIRSLALVVSIVFAGVSVIAQSHPPGHPQGGQHGPDHKRPGGAMDPALHALLHGTWVGSSSVEGSAPSKLQLAVSQDKLGNVIFKMTADRALRFGAAESIAAEGNSVQWTQDVSGTPCKAKAVLSLATTAVPQTMKGSLSCAGGDIPFTLQKTKS